MKNTPTFESRELLPLGSSGLLLNGLLLSGLLLRSMSGAGSAIQAG
ncbi:MAG: hypothetical protein ABSF43_03465 [Rectinemataceae bacterium]